MPVTRVEEFVEAGRDVGRGNLVGVQPYLTLSDYTQPAAFRAALGGYLEAARNAGWLNSRSLVVFPEYTGVWLIALGEREVVYRAAHTAQAMQAVALRHPLGFLKAWLASGEAERATAAIFRCKAAQAAALYQQIFGDLAAAYGVTIVGGSIILPAPQVQGGRLLSGHGPLYNVSAVFAPDGRLHPALSRKVYPIADELPFLRAGQASELPVFHTPAGRLGVLVCADSWYPPAYQRMCSAQAELLAVPSFIASNGAWEQPWGGYSGFSAPAGVAADDVQRISEGQAWRKYALAGRLASSGARAGVNVFLHGELWDLGSDSGQSLIVAGDQLHEASCRGAALLNLWLEGETA